MTLTPTSSSCMCAVHSWGHPSTPRKTWRRWPGDVKLLGRRLAFQFRLISCLRTLHRQEIECFNSFVSTNWLSRCHTFTLKMIHLKQPYDAVNDQAIGGLLQLHSYDRLQRLELSCCGRTAWGHILACLLEHIEETTSNLWHLTIDSRPDDIKAVIFSVFRRPVVLSRLTSLNVTCSHLVAHIPWENLPNIEEFQCHGTHLTNLSLVMMWRSTTLHFDRYFNPHMLPSIILGQITHLTLMAIWQSKR